jgi:large subunit ribosomal protein L29
MATMTSKEIREKEGGHLNHELAEAQKKLFELRGQAVTEKLEDPSQLRKTRKSIARMKTILRERTLETERKAQADAATKRKSEADAARKAAQDARKAAKAEKKSRKPAAAAAK